jgi:hypothetical protein
MISSFTSFASVASFRPWRSSILRTTRTGCPFLSRRLLGGHGASPTVILYSPLGVVSTP